MNLIGRMCEALGIRLLDLERIKFGPIEKGKLGQGNYRELTKNEVETLRSAAVIT